ncbi:MAG TPA: DedA family protein [Paenibacillus sp.]|nr:DedA family protein [Paenibacillus sp.]
MLHDVAVTMLAWLEGLGYWGIMIGLMLEVIPSEIVLSYGGYLVSQGRITFAGAVVFGTIGGVIAQLFVYWIGRYGGRPFLERYGKYILIRKKHIDVAERWFDRYGTGVIFAARFIPVVRHAISIPAGIARMPLGRFTLLTTLAVIPWSILFVWLGATLGERWGMIDEAAGPYAKPAMVIAAVALAAYMLFMRKRSKAR